MLVCVLKFSHSIANIHLRKNRVIRDRGGAKRKCGEEVIQGRIIFRLIVHEKGKPQNTQIPSLVA